MGDNPVGLEDLPHFSFRRHSSAKTDVTSVACRCRNSRPPTWSSDSTVKQRVMLPAGRATQKGEGWVSG